MSTVNFWTKNGHLKQCVQMGPPILMMHCPTIIVVASTFYVCNAINQRLCCICSKKGDTMPSADFYWRLKIVAWCFAALWYFKVNIFPDFSLMLHFTLFNVQNMYFLRRLKHDTCLKMKQRCFFHLKTLQMKSSIFG